MRHRRLSVCERFCSDLENVPVLYLLGGHTKGSLRGCNRGRDAITEKLHPEVEWPVSQFSLSICRFIFLFIYLEFWIYAAMWKIASIASAKTERSPHLHSLPAGGSSHRLLITANCKPDIYSDTKYISDKRIHLWRFLLVPMAKIHWNIKSYIFVK